jgi:hypothetical protein
MSTRTIKPVVKPTPGPWDVETDIMSYAAAIRRNWRGYRKTIAYVEGPGLSLGNHRRREQGLANARLLAAAPMLLAALEKIVAYYGREHFDGYDVAIAEARLLLESFRDDTEGP